MRKGFTLVELAFVMALMGVLITVSVIEYQDIIYGARKEEARTVLQAIAHAEMQYWRDHRSYLACSDERPVPTEAIGFNNSAECWKKLGIRIDSPVRYKYQVKLVDDSFVATAEADLDANGEANEIRLDGRTMNVDQGMGNLR